ncbi:MAG: DUF488 family protein [Xanthomonadales bacterium]|nr:DUF488 family protein [Xanthomonadales bacterium]
MALIRTKRVYLPRTADDGYRVLVDGIWPRGMTRQKADIDLWLREIAPTKALRQWYRHDAQKWPEFRRRYYEELDNNAESVAHLKKLLAGGPITLVYSSSETRLNNASALKSYLENQNGE